MTLNQKILVAINKHSDVINDEDEAIDDFKYQGLANELELLMLQEQKDFIGNSIKSSDTLEQLVDKLTGKFIELHNQIQKLKQ